MAQPRDHEQRDELDISAMPELRRVAEEVARSGRVRVLTENGKVVAEIVPLRAGANRSAEDTAAFLSAAGSWADVDTDKLIEDIYRWRDESPPKPPLEW